MEEILYPNRSFSRDRYSNDIGKRTGGAKSIQKSSISKEKRVSSESADVFKSLVNDVTISRIEAGPVSQDLKDVDDFISDMLKDIDG